MQQIEYANKLQKLGFELVGKGLYANVFAIPNTDKVIKVASLDGWPEYIRWSTKNGYAGKFAPKVDSLKFYESFYVAVMERLVDTMRGFEDYGRTSDQFKLYKKVIQAWRWNKENGNDNEGATELVQFMEKLREAGMTGDLHDGNVMVRKDGQIVVTDPVSYSNSEERFKIKSGKEL
jgi:hypothetical protein